MTRALRWLLAQRAPRLFLRLCAPDDRELGAVGEALAARWLARRGWSILGRRVVTPDAEIDVVARDAHRLVCFEVKATRWRAGGSRWRPGQRLDMPRLLSQRRAGQRLAAHFRARSGEEGLLEGGRVDVVEVYVGPGGASRIVHVPDLEQPLSN